MPASANRTHSAAPAELIRRTLVMHDTRASTAPPGHDRQSRMNVACRLAEVLGWAFGGNHEPGAAYADPPYFVPHDALLARDAEALGIHGRQDLFGGVVPHAFVATKAITHPLVDRNAVAPIGWSHAFAERAGESVLRGYTTFALADARRAAHLLLRDGPVRIKCVSGIGGAGQHLAESAQEIDAALAAIESHEFADSGVTVEEHLADNVTFSVGCVDCGGETIAYCGTQCTTTNSHGHEVYGGSALDVVRGGFWALLASDLSPDRRAAVELAQAYDAAAFSAYPGAFASRRNYDVLFGRDASGHRRAGVLEQSWRIGGASGAEVMAFAAFKRDPERRRVSCATVEIYDDACPVPEGAFIYYRGVDPHVGGLTKYAVELGPALNGDDA
jgi:hypothetical protein